MGLSHATVMLVLALAIDGAFGELPNRLHPVAWFGALAARLRATLPLTPPAPALLGGVALVAAGMACVGVLLVTDALLRERVPLLTDLAALFWLQASFAARALLTAGALVEQALVAGDLSLARARLGALCSRESAALSESELSGAAASSLAENLSDSVVAPLFYYALFGLGGALVFRVVNTLDAMVGYRGRYEWLGKPAATARRPVGHRSGAPLRGAARARRAWRCARPWAEACAWPCATQATPRAPTAASPWPCSRACSACGSRRQTPTCSEPRANLPRPPRSRRRAGW
jgi:cobalamin biosynthesis protein CobD/CbiB